MAVGRETRVRGSENREKISSRGNSRRDFEGNGGLALPVPTDAPKPVIRNGLVGIMQAIRFSIGIAIGVGLVGLYGGDNPAIKADS